ncbi:MAG: hypothetical protein K8I82_29750 [Anaerolineae bacterium]|nr:hypothetical protein [Anaerolineae bacterium]
MDWQQSVRYAAAFGLGKLTDRRSRPAKK